MTYPRRGCLVPAHHALYCRTAVLPRVPPTYASRDTGSGGARTIGGLYRRRAAWTSTRFRTSLQVGWDSTRLPSHGFVTRRWRCLRAKLKQPYRLHSSRPVATSTIAANATTADQRPALQLLSVYVLWLASSFAPHLQNAILLNHHHHLCITISYHPDHGCLTACLWPYAWPVYITSDRQFMPASCPASLS